jgi:hypothetical protein
MKKSQSSDDTFTLGYFDKNTLDIGINLTLVWDKAKHSEDKFIKSFSDIMQHETLHRVIRKVHPDGGTIMGEEVVVWKLQGWKMPKEVRKDYEKLYKIPRRTKSSC